MATTEHSCVARWQNDLLPHIVDRLGRDRPDAVYGMWPSGSGPITYRQLANAVNGLAWWIVSQLGQKHKGNEIEVLAYVGPNDVRLTALVLAAIKTGYVLFLTSPRNSPEAHQSLFDSLKCQTLITPNPIPPLAQAIIDAVSPLHIAVPSVEELMSNSYPKYAYNKTFEMAKWDPLLIIHTSGSTGLPKPLIWTHETGARHLNMASHEPPQGDLSLDQSLQGKRVIVTLPQFHGAGLLQYLLNAIPFGTIPIAPVPEAIATAQNLIDTLKQIPGGAEVAYLVPSVVAELAQNDSLLDYCAKHLKLIIYIGGDLPQAIGDKVAARVPLRCQWGASEVGIPHQLLMPEVESRLEKNWGYVRFHPCVGAVFEEVGSGADGIYELVIRKQEGLEDKGVDVVNTQPAFSIRGQYGPEFGEYRTRDLFIRHPTVPDAWRWQARADDIIVFLNGEKTNPISMEQHIVARNLGVVGGVLVVGTQRLQAALLVEPVARVSTTADQAGLIEDIWPTIQEANISAPAHARIEKSMILVTWPDRPLIRAGKGTIQRAASIALYQDDIETLYASIDADDLLLAAEHEVPVDTTDSEAVSRFIWEITKDVTGWPDLPPNTDMGPTTSFFDHGMDSLQALQLTRALRKRFLRPDIAFSTIYKNPTVQQLTDIILSGKTPTTNTDTDSELMQSLLDTYRSIIQQIPPLSPLPKPPPSPTPKPIDILLTGSTGSLGTHILHTLLNHQHHQSTHTLNGIPTSIRHIYCLNRPRLNSPHDPLTLHKKNFTSSNLDPQNLTPANLTFLTTNLTSNSPTLGLPPNLYNHLAQNLCLIIHAAWPVNFNQPLSTFTPHLTGLVNLFKLSALSKENPIKIVFISSVSAIAISESSSSPAPERIPPSNSTINPYPRYPNGYARSKYLAEMLCDQAARVVGIPVTVLRVGQVAGAVSTSRPTCGPCSNSENVDGEIPKGWNRSEWFPSLVISSLLELGCLPNDLGPQFSTIDWIPVDLLSSVILDLAVADSDSSEGGQGAQVFNVRNPRTTGWDESLPVVRERAGYHGLAVPEVVSPSVWLVKLQESLERGTGGDISNPAVKLLEFYRDGLWGENSASGDNELPMSIERALSASPTLRGVPAVSLEWMGKWVDEWLMGAARS